MHVLAANSVHKKNNYTNKFFLESNIDHKIPQEDILNLISQILNDENIKPSDDQVLVISQDETAPFGEILLRATMTDSVEYLGNEDIQIVTLLEVNETIEEKILFVEEFKEPKKINLKAFMNDSYEQKGNGEDEIVREYEFSPEIEVEAFILLDGPENKIVPTDEIPEDITLTTETEAEEIKIILDVSSIPF